MRHVRTRFGELDAVVIGDERADHAVVLCHGYGAPGEDLVPLGEELAALSRTVAERFRFVFPAAPLTLAEQGMPHGRAWWEIDLEALVGQRDWPRYVEATPEGLPRARRLLHALVEQHALEAKIPLGRTVLGGFSQGGMLATEVALRLEEPPLGLCALSSTLLAKESWTKLAAQRAGLPVFQTHGRTDPLLPFEVATSLRGLFEGAGMKVEFHPFEGGHTITFEGLRALARWLEARVAPPAVG